MTYKQLAGMSALLLFVVVNPVLFASEGTVNDAGFAFPWWGWAFLLLAVSFLLGILAVLAGVGGGILYIPIVSILFPFHIDFVRGAAFIVVLAGALSAAPGLLRRGLASLRLALPMAMASSIGTFIGSHMGLILPRHLIEMGLGGVILGVICFMVFVKRSDHPETVIVNKFDLRLGVSDEFIDQTTGTVIQWQVHRLKSGFLVFFIIGIMAGMFGLGAGWANVPALNLLLGAPLKVAAATSMIIIAINESVASWVYLNNGAVLPAIVVPSLAGMMMGTRLGVKLLGSTNPKVVRRIVIVVLVLASMRSFLSGVEVL